MGIAAVVTGANGFIGSALLQELSGRGVQIFAVIKDKGERVDEISKLPGVQLVYCDMDELSTLVDKVYGAPELFYHLAWVGSTGEARGDYMLQLTDVRWTLDAVNAAAAIGCKRFIGAGTLAEFDAAAYVPLDGSDPNRVSTYATAKIAAHYMSKAECAYVGISHLWAYLSNTYGIGNYTSNFINSAVKTMLTGKSADFTTGEQPYDFVYISDIAQGLCNIGMYGTAGHSYYIGSTHPQKLKKFIMEVRDEIDPNIQLNLGAVPFKGVAQPESTFDCSKLIRDTGYCPKISFQEGIQRTIPWIRDQLREGRI